MICFTKEKVPVCSKKCKSTVKVEQSYEVHCRSKKDSVGQLMKQQILRGDTPDLKSKAPNGKRTFKVDKACIPF